MKRIILLALSGVGLWCGTVNAQCAPPLTTGLYVAESPDNAEYSSYLRFYDDGTVLMADSKAPFEEVQEWMEQGRETITETTYDLNEKKCKLEYEIELDDTKVTYTTTIAVFETLEVVRKIKGGGETTFNYTFTEVDFDE